VWIEPQVDVDMVSIPLSLVDDNWNTHFRLLTTAGDFTYMAYRYSGEMHVRANVCPPCRSIGYSLDGDNLVCDMCATTFEAATGDGISGACVDFPKAEVPYEIKGGNIVMNGADLIAAYQDTLKPGLP
jgi:nitrite reductase/ring-hydroxylating ferredoxin subunit